MPNAWSKRNEPNPPRMARIPEKTSTPRVRLEPQRDRPSGQYRDHANEGQYPRHEARFRQGNAPFLFIEGGQPCGQRSVLDENSGIGGHQQHHRSPPQDGEYFPQGNARVPSWPCVVVLGGGGPDDGPEDSDAGEHSQSHLPAHQFRQRDRPGHGDGYAQAEDGGVEGVDAQHFPGPEPLHHQWPGGRDHERQSNPVGQP